MHAAANLAMLMLTAVIVGGCERQPSPTTAPAGNEKIAEHLRSAGQELKAAATQAATEVKPAVERAAEEARETVHRAAEKLSEATSQPATVPATRP